MDQTGSDKITKNSQRGLPLIAGLALAAAGFGMGLILQPSSQSLLFWLGFTAVLGGLIWAALAAWLPQGAALRFQCWLTGNLLVFTLMLGLAEGGFRLAGVNFNNLTGQTDDPRAHYPLCLRMPDRPLGEIYFTRAGPLTWTGRPLSTFLKINHGTDIAYEDEVEFTARYDANGFRNPDDQTDWQAVVVGDSFTESGALPYEQIFTTVAAQNSGTSIRNLGVCNTGILAHLEYLRRFGKGPSTRRAILAFYEGNDILDTAEEQSHLNRYRDSGWRPDRTPRPQTSLIKASYQVAKHLISRPPAIRYQNAWLTTSNPEIPITVRGVPMPLDPESFSSTQKAILDDVIQQWAQTCRALDLEPWLLYIPANNRTYHGLVRFTPDAEATTRDWQPGSMPDYMQRLCAQRSIHFINAYPVLRRSAEKGILVYNRILDTHLNQEGSQLIGELLAKHLSDAKTGSLEKTRP